MKELYIVQRYDSDWFDSMSYSDLEKAKIYLERCQEESVVKHRIIKRIDIEIPSIHTEIRSILEAAPENLRDFNLVFGNRWWNDTENIYCVPVAEITLEEEEQLGIENLRKYSYLICYED